RLLSRKRKLHAKEGTAPLFKDSETAPALFNEEGEQEVGNPLLASWGKLGRDYTYLLSGLERFEELDVFVDLEPDNLLHSLQFDLLELRNQAQAGVTLEEFERSDGKRLLDPDDRSISVHVCHSPQREVE
ncbi:exodeoxyribonuclease V subunit gamma, partial [Cronobacter sakazakii]|uniref:exodeoxyribonuclease V subunit gamma n=1 Tax=Cronobacter sakazakii TaxID=28141 RepID=UPI000B0EF7CC